MRAGGRALSARPEPRHQPAHPPAMSVVEVVKRELRFTLNSDGNAGGDVIAVHNVSGEDVAFKVKTTNPHRYIVRPNVGTIAPGASLDVQIWLQSTRDPPAPGASKDKFLLRACVAPGIASSPTPADFWARRDADPGVVGFKFRVEFVVAVPTTPANPAVALEAPVPPPAPTAAIPTSPRVEVPPALLAGSIVSPTSVLPNGSAPRDAPQEGERAELEMGDADVLLREGNYELAMSRVRDLQAMLDAKNLELARLKTELAETRASTDTVLKEAPKAPLSANKVFSDPFGGVSIAGLGLMFLLFLALFKFISSAKEPAS